MEDDRGSFLDPQGRPKRVSRGLRDPGGWRMTGDLLDPQRRLKRVMRGRRDPRGGGPLDPQGRPVLGNRDPKP